MGGGGEGKQNAFVLNKAKFVHSNSEPSIYALLPRFYVSSGKI